MKAVFDPLEHGSEDAARAACKREHARWKAEGRCYLSMSETRVEGEAPRTLYVLEGR